MATIHKPKKKPQKMGRSKEAADLYNSKNWKKLRLAYYMQHPVCEICLLEDKITPAEEIHHKKPILTGSSRLEMLELLLNPDNLIALCKEHHHKIHNELRKNKRK